MSETYIARSSESHCHIPKCHSCCVDGGEVSFHLVGSVAVSRKRLQKTQQSVTDLLEFEIIREREIVLRQRSY